MAGTLIIGASQAGVQLASSLRELGYTDPVTLVGAKEHPPYQRPPLSKALLLGDATPESLLFRAPGFYPDQGIDLVTGERVVTVEKAADGSGIATSASGRRFPFDRLALTVGARARRLPVPGNDLAGVHYLRDSGEALRLREQLQQASDVLVVGGGFIGLEVAASARTLGRSVTVVLADDRLMNRAVQPPISDFFAEAHRRRGVDVHFGVALSRFVDDGAGRVGRVELADGRTFQADLVVVGIGAVPRTELAEQLGLAVDDGVVVDEHGVAPDGTTVAAGDCVSCPSPVPGPFGRMRFESVSTAVEQAKVAAATLAGVPVPYRAAPWFWSDQFDLKLQAAGLSAVADRYVVRGDPAAEKFSVLYYCDGLLVAAECVNSPADLMAVRTALAKGRTVPPELADDTSVPLKKLMQDVAVGAAEDWAATPPRRRGEILQRAFALLQERKDDFALVMTREMGKPLAEAYGEITYGGEFLRWFAEEAPRISGRYGDNPAGTGRIVVSRRPVGPCYLITPWNFPLAMATRKIAPALAAGCTVVVKPAELTPLTTLLFTALLTEAGVPAGVVNVVTTSEPGPLSARLIGDRRLRKLSFTGSTPVGRRLLAQAADNVLRTSMELGGNAPFLVFADADLDAAVDGAMAAKFRRRSSRSTPRTRPSPWPTTPSTAWRATSTPPTSPAGTA